VRRTPLLASLALLAAPLGAVVLPAASAHAAGPDYTLYVTGVYGADLGACREPARKGTAWRIRGLVDATGAVGEANPKDFTIRGGLLVTSGGEETGNAWVAKTVQPGTTATGAVVVRKTAKVQISGFVGTDNAGDSFQKAPAQIKPC
jgi:hypothetical protein